MFISDPPTIPYPNNGVCDANSGAFALAWSSARTCSSAYAPPSASVPKTKIDNRRIAWKARDAALNFFKRQLAGPDKCHAIAKPCELALELSTPEPADSSGPDHHEDLLRLGEYAQNVIDQCAENR